ncbi:MAG: hypothetical protein J6J44_06320 [Lachnospiraceae bacterium]|nr:hypothetical protein [Lachnospiraceae bacterium]
MSLLKQNEKEANLIVAKVMRISFIIFTLIFILNVIGIFEVKPAVMTFAYIGGSILLLLPTLLCNFLKMEHWIIKYINVLCAAVFITLLSITLTWHVVAMYVYPIAIASLYFSKKLNISATVLTVLGVSIGQVLAYFMETTLDDNFTEVRGMIIFGVIPRALVVIAVAAIFTMLCGRTASMLSNLMGAEEQKEMFDRMKAMKDSASQTSAVLYNTVSQLSEISESSLRANQSIAEEAERLLTGSLENTGAVEYADERIQAITTQLADLSEMNHRTAQLTERIGQNTVENQKLMDAATENMNQINKSTEECEQIIKTLGEESQEIIGIVQTITGISSKTNILALNASIEAARAGEQGKGFAVVAEEIQKLSEQTKKAVESIGDIVNEVVKNTEDAVAAMDENAKNAKAGMESIQLANKSATLITSSNEELVGQIHEIDKAAEVIREKSNEVADRMQQISSNTQANCTAVEQVSAATQENTAGTESLTNIVEQIKGLSEKLNSVVQG